MVKELTHTLLTFMDHQSEPFTMIHSSAVQIRPNFIEKASGTNLERGTALGLYSY
jgi:hypothetical protein